jgi:hypothetical protein
MELSELGKVDRVFVRLRGIYARVNKMKEYNKKAYLQ